MMADTQVEVKEPTHPLWVPVAQALMRFRACQCAETLEAYRIAAKAFDSRKAELVAELKTMCYSDEWEGFGL
jgi:hypothetical protein